MAKKKKHQYGLVHDRHDDRDLRFSAVANKLQIVKLPKKVDLRNVCSPVRDQDDLGSCTGFATITAFRECLLMQSGKPFNVLSPLFQYYWTRVFEHSVNEDSGATIRGSMKTLAKYGAALESAWPYDIAKFRDQPPAEIVKIAKHAYPITKYHRVNNQIEIKQALSIKHPVVIGIEVWESFESDAVTRTGKVPVPNFNTESLLGGHAVCLVGYDDATKTYLAKNSWGTKWGVGGYALLPYAYFNPKNRLVMDMWTGRA